MKKTAHISSIATKCNTRINGLLNDLYLITVSNDLKDLFRTLLEDNLQAQTIPVKNESYPLKK